MIFMKRTNVLLKNCYLTVALLMAVNAMGALPNPPSVDEHKLMPSWKKVVASDATIESLCINGEATLPAKRMGENALYLPVNFVGTKAKRANWDIKLPCDLRGRQGAEFDFYCSDLNLFSSFSLYFKSGNGWYHTTFSPDDSGKWCRIRVVKSQAITEDAAEGWGNISQIRISAWRNGDGTAECGIANLMPMGSDPDIAIVYADSLMAKRGRDAKAYMVYAERITSSLEALGISTVTIADTDLSDDLLKDVKAVILPYNTSFPEEKVPVLHRFRDAGGKFLVSYTWDKNLCDLVGVENGDFINPQKDGLPAIGGFLRKGEGFKNQPEFVVQRSWMTAGAKAKTAKCVAEWGTGDKKSMNLPALFLSEHGFYMCHVWLGGTDGEHAKFIRAIACELVPGLENKIIEREKVAEKEAQALRKWLATLPSAKNEHRAFWCHDARGLGAGKNWDDSIRLLKENGFNAIHPNLCWSGTAFYKSDVLPVAKDVATRGDAFEECMAACRKYGVKCHMWKVCWFMGACATKEFEEKMVAEKRTQVSVTGKAHSRWLCPSHPKNQKMEVDAMVELARKGADGVHFDYIRYSGENYCYCDGCRERFNKKYNLTVNDLASEIGKDEKLRKLWKEFRRENITAVVKEVSRRVRKDYPKVEISAAVFHNPVTDPETIGQDWSMWCRNGWLDFVCPMDYVESRGIFRSLIRKQKQCIGNARIYPGIGLSTWHNPTSDAEKLANQILVLREEGLGGFTVFNYDRRAERVLPLMKLGLTK